MGEVIHGEYDRWVRDDMLHSVTNYALHKAFWSAHNDRNYFEIAHTIRRLPESGIRLYTFADNHDEDRLTSKLTNPAHLAPLYTLLFPCPAFRPSTTAASGGSRESGRPTATTCCGRR